MSSWSSVVCPVRVMSALGTVPRTMPTPQSPARSSVQNSAHNGRVCLSLRICVVVVCCADLWEFILVNSPNHHPPPCIVRTGCPYTSQSSTRTFLSNKPEHASPRPLPTTSSPPTWDVSSLLASGLAYLMRVTPVAC